MTMMLQGSYYIVISVLLSLAVCEISKFRILAPEFICPKDEDTPVDKPDNTVITLQTPAGADFPVLWTVRWNPLPAPTQRHTIMLWKAVRALEARLNKKPNEPYVYVIENKELLHGVDYVFTVSAIEPDGTLSTPKAFHIDNTQGDQKLDMVEGRSDLLSVMLLGSLHTFADEEFELVAEVTTCYPTQDYYFIWTVRSTDEQEQVDVSFIKGSKLRVPANVLKPGLTYDAKCDVIKLSSNLRITQTGIPFQVLHRSLEVHLNMDYLRVPTNQAFTIEAVIINHDYYKEAISITWECTFGDDKCDFEFENNEILEFPLGLNKLGEYEIKITVQVMDQTASSFTKIIAVEHSLPVIQISPIGRIVNEGTTLTLVANATKVAPTCTLTWYFATKEFLASNLEANSTCEDCQHGEALSETLEIFSLEENFLNELADFTNETEWRQVTAEMPAADGRARFVARCGCSLTFDCATEGVVYADVAFQLNESPKAEHVMVSPDTGTALETVFRISTKSVVDQDGPLRYSFYCNIGVNDTLLLGSFKEHLAVETFLPFVGTDGIKLWVEVCDILGACSVGLPKVLQLYPGGGTTVDMLVEKVHGHARRCEMTQIITIAKSAIITYMNPNLPEVRAKFIKELSKTLTNIDEDCTTRTNKDYSDLLTWLEEHGVDNNINTRE